MPVLADLRPSGRYHMSELIRIGGIRPLMKRLLEKGLLHGDCLTVTGKTLEQDLKDTSDYPKNQQIIRGWDDPIKADGHLVILKGNLAPRGAVAKITGKEGTQFTGSARVFNSEEEALQSILSGKIKKGNIIVIRYEGPRGGPGMREMLSPTSAIMGQGLGTLCCVDYRRTVFGRQSWICRRTYHPRSSNRRSFSNHRKRRFHYD